MKYNGTQSLGTLSMTITPLKPVHKRNTSLIANDKGNSVLPCKLKKYIPLCKEYFKSQKNIAKSQIRKGLCHNSSLIGKNKSILKDKLELYNTKTKDLNRTIIPSNNLIHNLLKLKRNIVRKKKSTKNLPQIYGQQIFACKHIGSIIEIGIYLNGKSSQNNILNRNYSKESIVNLKKKKSKLTRSLYIPKLYTMENVLFPSNKYI